MSLWLGLSPMLLALAGAIAAMAFDGAGKRSAAVTFGSMFLFSAAVVSGWLGFNADLALLDGVAVAVGKGYSMVSMVVYLIAAITLLGGSTYLAEVPFGGQVAALTSLLAAASALLASSLDLLLVIIALETIAILSYALVSVSRSRRGDEAAMKYFIQGAVATGFALYAFSILFALYGGSAFLPEIAGTAGELAGPAALLAMVLLMGMYAYKLGAFPFHSWAPDAYETAVPSVTAFMGTAPKLAVLTSLMLVFPLLGFSAQGFSTAGYFVLALLAVASILFGNLTGLKQTSFTRMLAYSGIAQMGYALVGASAMFAASGARNAFAVIVAGIAYSIGAAGAFMGAQAVRAALPAWDGSVAGLAGIGRKRPLLAAAMAVMMLSLTGIPLFAGFWGKFLAFADAIVTGNTWLAVIGMLGSVISFGYYGNVIRAMYLEEPAALPEFSVGADKLAEGTPDTVAESATIVLALLVIVIGILPLFAGFDALIPLFRTL